MSEIELKTILINRISDINDASLLKELISFLDSKAGTGVFQLTQEQFDDIISSRKETEKGLFIKNNVLKKEVRRWLNAR